MGRSPLTGEAKRLSEIKRLQWQRDYEAPQRRIKKGVENYHRVMKDFYTKSHRLACYKQLIMDVKGIKETSLYLEPKKQENILDRHKIRQNRKRKLRQRKRDYEISPRWNLKIAI